VEIAAYMNKLGQQARIAGREISKAESGKKNQALVKIAEALSGVAIS